MKRLSTAGLLELGASLSEAERALIQDLARLGLMSHRQLTGLLAPSAGEAAARAVRRQLKRLTDAGVLARLDRRIGGVRAGSSGFVYYLGPGGQRLQAYWLGHGLVRGRFRPEPAGRHVRHRLAISELYVQLRQAAREGLLELLAFDAEPDCWRAFGDGLGGERILKPDAVVRIGLGAYEDRYFIEIDLATESRSVVANKIRAYHHYYNAGIEQQEHGVFPRVLLLTNSEQRTASLVKACARLPAEAWQLFTITTLDNAMTILSSGLEGQAKQEAEALS